MIPLDIVYIDGTGANCSLGTDNIEIDGVEIKDCYIAVSDEASENYGVLGIGPVNLEVTTRNADSFVYNNLQLTMKAQGLISKNTYSIYLDEFTDTNSAAVLFGGIDHNKYVGDLGLLPIASANERIDVILNSISVSNGSGEKYTFASGAATALLDTGTAKTLLPTEIVQALSSYVGRDDGSNLIANCEDIADVDLTFEFLGHEITVPLLGFVQGKTGNQCTIGIQDSDTIILGDTFLSGAYFVADLDSNQVALAVANLESADENIEPIVDTIPSATMAPNYSQSQTATSLSAIAASSTSLLSHYSNDTTTIKLVKSMYFV
ncbi:unnamed protein product [Ambrosiozyma monospora]|uniref:Unnamed protein product n=1 Tax=Ambrosiozyma monospora TaxID=43982 RepID=A0A9W6Z8A3_AMBMO|nr:unnamed protein product [Ambrosiozyma monospora]